MSGTGTWAFLDELEFLTERQPDHVPAGLRFLEVILGYRHRCRAVLS
jgi:hypothetical protein